MPRYARVPGVRVESVDDIWAAFSPASGETLLLNDLSAAVLEVLAAHGALSATAVAEHLAADSGSPRQDVLAALQDCWSTLLQEGLVRDADAG